jgi:hypothetical protein
MGETGSFCPDREVITADHSLFPRVARRFGAAGSQLVGAAGGYGYTVHAPCAAAGPGRAARQPEPGREVDGGNLAT